MERTPRTLLIASTMFTVVLLSLAVSAQRRVAVDGYVGGIGFNPPVTFEDARVNVSHLETGKTWALTTDAEGRFSVDIERAGIVAISVQVDGFVPTLAYRRVGPHGASVALGLDIATLDERVSLGPLELVDANGEPVANAKVTAVSHQSQEPMGVSYTDARGRLPDPCDRGGTFVVALVVEAADAHPSAVREDCLSPGHTGRLTVPLVRHATRAGTPGTGATRRAAVPVGLVVPLQILTDVGGAARGVMVSFSQDTGELLRGTTDAKGALRANAAHAKAAAWVIDHPGYAPAIGWRGLGGSARVTLHAQSDADAEPWNLDGQLLGVAGEPAPNADVIAHSLDALGIASQAKTDAAGRFRIEMSSCAAVLLIGLGDHASGVTVVPCADAATTPVTLGLSPER